MNLIEFKDYPDKSKPYTAANMNHNFTEVKKETDKIKNELILSMPKDIEQYSGLWTNVKIPGIKELYSYGNGLSFKNEKINIEDDNISFVKITFCLKWTPGNANGNRGIYLYKNGESTNLSYFIHTFENGGWETDTFVWIEPVSKDDYIEFYKVLGGSSGTSVYGGGYAIIEPIYKTNETN